MADNTEQFEFIQMVQGNLDALFPDFVAGDHLWYPVEGEPAIRVAPDVYVALGRPKGHRGSYKQWEEAGVPLAVVFEWWSPNITFTEQVRKLRFYEKYGVAEFYTWGQVGGHFAAFVREAGALAPVDTTGGFVSPLLGIRFEVEGGALVLYDPTGARFRSFREIRSDEMRLAAERDHAARERDEAARERDEAARERDEAARERDQMAARAEALAAKLRSLGMDPEG